MEEGKSKGWNEDSPHKGKRTIPLPKFQQDQEGEEEPYNPGNPSEVVVGLGVITFITVVMIIIIFKGLVYKCILGIGAPAKIPWKDVAAPLPMKDEGQETRSS